MITKGQGSVLEQGLEPLQVSRVGAAHRGGHHRSGHAPELGWLTAVAQRRLRSARVPPPQGGAQAPWPTPLSTASARSRAPEPPRRDARASRNSASFESAKLITMKMTAAVKNIWIGLSSCWAAWLAL